ncbi:MAG: hypothetical protein G01um101433_1013 [Parcubacteria group bacterium Gr01-1014_33]|nr:MAG: hypothetical protein G01um101433_1013 [Parcubacteria group bacterium Gr01-1014_33]
MIPLSAFPKVVSQEGARAVFEIEGLFPGYGQTIGNSLRRVLLSSLEGAVITSIKIEGVGHEFSTIEGVMEDVVEIILNLKQMRFRVHEPGPFTVTLAAKGEQDVSGKDFDHPSQVEVITKDVHIATLSAKKASLNIEAVVESGLGYVPVEARSKEKVEVGTIALDAAFSPVRHVNYEVENMRVGDRTDYNLLRLHIETDGSLTPHEAFQRAADILVQQFSVLSKGFAEDNADGETRMPKGAGWGSLPEKENRFEESETKEESVLKIKLEDLSLSSRTLNVLREGGIKTVGGLLRKREETLREIEGMGDKGIQEVKKALGSIGVGLKE